MVQPGPFAYLALLFLIPASIAAFALLDPRRATLLVFFGSFLTMPELVRFDIPAIDLSKRSTATLCVLIGIFVTARDRIREARLGRPTDWLMLLTLLVPLGTVFGNPDIQVQGPVVQPALSFKDLIRDTVAAGVELVAPFFIGRVMFRTEKDAKDLLRTLLLCGIIYVPFILIELRMSPQFHNWIYGYAPSDFIQAMRGSGYRPMVFMNHGLTLAMFMWGAIVSGWLLVKLREKLFGIPAAYVTTVLTLLFPALKSLASFLYGLTAVPMIWLVGTKKQIRFAALLALLVLFYPLFRASPLFPHTELVDLAARYASQDRAESLEFRFVNEEVLLDRALERPTFGWGGWARGHVFDETGKDTTVVDGEWIIALGTNGVVGFLIYFGMLVTPIFVALRRHDRASSSERILLGGFSLLTGFRALDLVPNSDMTMGLLFAGTLSGLSYSAGQGARNQLRPLLIRLAKILKSQGLLPAPQTSPKRATYMTVLPGERGPRSLVRKRGWFKMLSRENLATSTMTLRALALFLVPISLFACGTTGTYTWASQLPQTAVNAEPVLRVGDRVQVVVYGQDAMSGEAEVRLGGDIVLPVTGRVQAQGHTVTQLTELIRNRLQGILAEPRVSVVIASRRPAGVSVVGEVTEPGRFDMRDGEGVLDAIARAQGLTPFASEDKIFVIRRHPNLLRVRFRYSDLRGGDSASVGFELKDGDVVVAE